MQCSSLFSISFTIYLCYKKKVKSTNDLLYTRNNILCDGGEEMIRPDTFFCFDGQQQEMLFAWTIEDIASKIYLQTSPLSAVKPVLDYGEIEYRNGDSIFAGSTFSTFLFFEKGLRMRNNHCLQMIHLKIQQILLFTDPTIISFQAPITSD